MFTNTGNETLEFAQLSEGLGVGYPVQWWGLTLACCTQVRSAVAFNVTLPGDSLRVGQSIGAGYLLSFYRIFSLDLFTSILDEERYILKYNASLTLADPEFESPIVQTQFFNWVVCSQ